MGESAVSMLAARIREMDAEGTEAPWVGHDLDEDGEIRGVIVGGPLGDSLYITSEGVPGPHRADGALIVLLRNVAGPVADLLDAAAEVNHYDEALTGPNHVTTKVARDACAHSFDAALDRLSAALAGVVAAARDESPDT